LFLVPLASRPTTEKVVSRPLLTAKLSRLSPLFSFQGSAHCQLLTAKVIIQPFDLTVNSFFASAGSLPQ
jgi:hypothetical protein